MRLSVVSLLMILTTVILSACGRDELAVLDDRSQLFFGRGGTVNFASASFTTAPTIQAAPDNAISSRNLVATPQHALAPINSGLATDRPIIAANNPWQWPVNGTVSEHFGKQSEGIANEGITIEVPSGTPIRAAQAGEVAYVGHGVRDYGNIVILRHPGGDMTSYAHASDIAVTKGQLVAAGATLGHVGKSGNAKTSQLHFALRSGERAVDPLTRLPSQVASRS